MVVREERGCSFVCVGPDLNHETLSLPSRSRFQVFGTGYVHPSSIVLCISARYRGLPRLEGVNLSLNGPSCL